MSPIVALGGSGDTQEWGSALRSYVLGAAGNDRPLVLYVPTAVGDASEAIVRFYDNYRGLGDLSHLKFFPWPPEDARELVLSQDVIIVSGGNTANMLAIWRLHGFDRILREAWEQGIVLSGASAGMICWFEACVTDSFGPELQGMRDGLGFLPGSACPHYDGEEQRRPVYTRLVREERLPAGVAADDGVALRYDRTELVEVVTSREGARAYRVERDGETPLDARLL